jgi:lipopolysaccharide/colanic/teichoic acid biosynthesis glycosyltransferase
MSFDTPGSRQQLMIMHADGAVTYLPAETGFADRSWSPRLHRAPERRRNALARRALNVVLALVLLVALFPLMLLVALLVRLTSPGPILYTQARVGVDRRGGRSPGEATRRIVDHGGRLFRIYKFRTMRVQDPTAAQRWATPDDPRVTPVGRFLRASRLDELPQLWNVLRGDMNIVGPRPEQPMIFAELREQIPGYRDRQRVLPGITGLAQISQAYDRCLDDVKRKVGYDLEYIRRESPLQDLRILLWTLPAVIAKRGGW